MQDKKQRINAGIEKAVIRTGKDTLRTIAVQEWIDNDDSIFLI